MSMRSWFLCLFLSFQISATVILIKFYNKLLMLITAFILAKLKRHEASQSIMWFVTHYWFRSTNYFGAGHFVILSFIFHLFILLFSNGKYLVLFFFSFCCCCCSCAEYTMWPHCLLSVNCVNTTFLYGYHLLSDQSHTVTVHVKPGQSSVMFFWKMCVWCVLCCFLWTVINNVENAAGVFFLRGAFSFSSPPPPPPPPIELTLCT